MNIYFSCSITGGRQDQQVYHAIVELLLKAGHEVPTAHLSRADVMEKETTIDPAEVYHRDVTWVLGLRCPHCRGQHAFAWGRL